MNILIVEDEALAVERLKKLLLQVEGQAQIMAVTGSVEATVEWLQAHRSPDLILMDIELADGQSFEIFSRVQVSSPIIFTTSYDEYAIRAFKVNSIDYLLKPIKGEELKASLEKLHTFKQLMGQTSQPVLSQQIEQLIRQLRPATQPYRNRFLVKTGFRYLSVETNEIAYFYYQDRFTFLKTWKNAEFIVDFSLDDLEQMLSPENFFRANRQYILHIRSICLVQDYFNHKLKLTLQPATSEEVLISRERASEFKIWMGK
jgi:two-component system, LytTR family, response regulator LytT